MRKLTGYPAALKVDKKRAYRILNKRTGDEVLCSLNNLRCRGLLVPQNKNGKMAFILEQETKLYKYIGVNGDKTEPKEKEKKTVNED